MPSIQELSEYSFLILADGSCCDVMDISRCSMFESSSITLWASSSRTWSDDSSWSCFDSNLYLMTDGLWFDSCYVLSLLGRSTSMTFSTCLFWSSWSSWSCFSLYSVCELSSRTSFLPDLWASSFDSFGYYSFSPLSVWSGQAWPGIPSRLRSSFSLTWSFE